MKARAGKKYFQETGRQGGLAAGSRMTPEQRSERARKAANALWAQKRKDKKK